MKHAIRGGRRFQNSNKWASNGHINGAGGSFKRDKSGKGKEILLFFLGQQRFGGYAYVREVLYWG